MAQVSVAVPVHDDALDLLPRAVGSLLGQRGVDVEVIVVGDGLAPEAIYEVLGPLPVRIASTPPRGRYFADAVGLGLATAPWFCVHDADDYSEPDRLRALLDASDGAEMVLGGWTHHGLRASAKRAPRPYVQGRLSLLTQHCSVLWSTESLRSIGGPHPGFTIAWDVAQVALGARHLRMARAHDFGYHYCARAGSLSTAPQTGMRSRMRRQAHTRRLTIWRSTDGMSREQTAAYIASDAGTLSEEVACLSAHWSS